MKKQFSNRLLQLGTETAFSVSEDANKYIENGRRVFPFHLGDINIATPKNIIEAAINAMNNGKTGYVPSAGIMELRDVIADFAGKERGMNLNANNIVVQPGGKPVISKFIQTLMNSRDAVLYPNPGYPIYESQIEFNGGKAIPYGYITTSNGFMIDREKVEFLINSHRPRILIYNNQQNPMGYESDFKEMEWIAELAEKHNLWVLSDEAYFNIRYSGKSHSIAALPGMKERTIILYTFSKTYAMTGWRLGAAMGPEQVMNIFAQLSVNDESCTNHFIQYAGIEALTGTQVYVNNILLELKKRRDILFGLLSEIDGLTLLKPDSTFYLFPDITELYYAMNCKSYEEFRSRILVETGVSFCTREHFGSVINDNERKYIRFAYSGIDINDIKEGISRMKNYLLNIESKMSI